MEYSDVTSPRQILSLPDSDFDNLLKSNMKYKERSHNTHTEVHIPELRALTSEAALDTVLIGHSMLERFKTTGCDTKVAHLPSSFNAGVGGDKIENVLYRIQIGLLQKLESRKPKVWVVCIGTNNLRPKGTLRDTEVERFRLLLHALLRTSPGSRVLATGISYRKDIPDEVVNASSASLKQVVDETNESLGGGERIFWQDAPESLKKDEHLVDHVHFNEEGYRVWDEVLYPEILRLLSLPPLSA